MNKFIQNIIEVLKTNDSVYFKAWPSDITIYELSQDNKKALISWSKENKGWFDIDKIYFCCEAWTYGDSQTANKCNQYKQEFDSQFIKNKTR